MWKEEHKALWEGLHQRTCRLFAVWRLYRALFGNETTVAQMNAISGTGFRLIQDCMVNEQIRIAMALTDGEGQGDRSNLTIKRLLSMLGDDRTKGAKEKLEAIEKPLEVLRAHRNKRLQHFDLNTATGGNALPKLMTDHLDEAVKGIGEVLSEVSSVCTNTVQAYDHIIIDNANGALQWMISDSVRMKRLNALAANEDITDSQIRALAKHRSDRHDREILGEE